MESEEFRALCQMMEDQDNENFDKIYLPLKQSLPEKLKNRSQVLDNFYFISRFTSAPSKQEYHCTNNSCKKELFYYDSINGLCSKCETKITDDIYNEMKHNIEQYQELERVTQNSINIAIEESTQKIFPKIIINEIQKYVAMCYVKYHIMEFNGEEYTGDNKSIHMLLNKNKNIYKFGDIVEIDAYGHHFIGMTDKNELKIITNPSYDGYGYNSTVNLLCVPFEISDEMPDVVRFYRLNNINLFKANGCDKIGNFPVSIVSLSFNHSFVRKLFSLSQSEKFDETFKFYLQSENFQNLDMLHINIFDDELQTYQYKSINNQVYSIIKEQLFILSETIKKVYTFLLICKQPIKNVKKLQNIIDMVDYPRSIKWKVLGPYGNSLKVWKISIPGKYRDMHFDNLVALKNYHEIEVDVSLFIMVFYGKELLLNEDFKKWISDIKQDNDVQRVENMFNERSRIEIFWFPTEKFEKYPFSEDKIMKLQQKYKDDLVIKWGYFFFDPSFLQKLLSY